MILENDTSLARPVDVLLALSLLSRLPIPEQRNWQRQARAVWAYPLAGLVLGGMAAALGLLASALGLPAPICALVSLGALIILSGAMHEDGLADCADGFWGGWSAARRLEIMKDSGIGSYGAIALFLSLGARWAALGSLWGIGAGVAIPAIMASAIVSRAMMPVVMRALLHARADGLSRQVGPVRGDAVALGLGLALGLSLLLVGWSAFGAGVAAALALAGMIALARAKIGGQTGDVLGATQQVTEIAVLFWLIS